jgi:ankyrin repeat protein
MKRLAAVFALLFAGWLFVSCDDVDLSKEQRQLNDAIKHEIAFEPSRINMPYLNGEPPVHVALSNQLPGLFRWLLDRGADPNVRDEEGATALHKAVLFDSRDHRSLRALLRHGGKINAAGKDGGTPLHVAAFFSRATTVETLLTAGGDPNARDKLGGTPLHSASTPQPTARPEDVVRTIHLLVAGGADVAARRTRGDTPLHMAALIGSDIAARSLLREGAPVNEAGPSGETALHVAAVFGKANIAQLLLEAGAAPNPRDAAGLTPLGRALHYPAVTASAQRTGLVDTSAVVEVLKRFGGTDLGVRPGVTDSDRDVQPVVKDNVASPDDFYRKLDACERFSGGDAKEAGEVVEFLDRYLKDPERYAPDAGAVEQARAALVLFRMKPDSAVAKSRLTELMDFVRESDDSVPDYLGIARGLKKLGAKAEPLYPALLLDAVTDIEVENRKLAIDALASIVPSRQSLIASLKRVQVDNWETEKLIANISPSEGELRSELTRALRHPDPVIRARAVSVVSVIRSPDATMLSYLERLQWDSDAHVRERALKACEALHGCK